MRPSGLRPQIIRRMTTWHRWLSLITFAMVVIWCGTGVPLIFHDPIDVALGVLPPQSPTGPALPLERIVEAARAERPDDSLQALMRFHDRDDIWAAGVTTPQGQWDLLAFREDTAAFVKTVDRRNAFMTTLLNLHRELCRGAVGKWAVIIFGVVWFGSLATGMLLYGPHMRRLDFGRVRMAPNHVNASDWHKLLGAVTLVWNIVLAFTGVALELSTFVGHERMSSVKAFTHRPSAVAVSHDAPRVPLSVAVAKATEALPGHAPVFVYAPGSELAGPDHTVLFMSQTGHGPVRPRHPVIVNADGSEVTQLPLPWWAPTMDVLAAVHFGRGSIAYKLLWSLFAVATLVLGFTGLVVFALRHRTRRARVPGRMQQGFV